MAKKIQYRSMDVEQVSTGMVREKLAGETRLVVGIDVAKRNFVAALCDGAGETQVRIRFEHPRQTGRFVDLMQGLRDGGCTVEVAMEPTGTYGDALRYQLSARAVPVYRVTNKHVADAAEVFDGSPSKHDGKDASVIGWLHAQKRSKPWPELDPTRRSVRALVSQRELYDEPLRKLIAQMEPLLARHFPELEHFFDLSRRKTPYRLLESFGSPAALARAGVPQLSALIKKLSRRTPAPELVQQLVNAAHTTSGTPMVSEEIELIRRMAKEVLHLMALRDEVDARIERATDDVPTVVAMRFLGTVTAAVIYAYLGDPRSYESAAAYEKAAGLNLVESSSGTDPSARDKVYRRISKRGPGVVRKYLFLAAMRFVQTDPIGKAWYQRRRSFTAEEKTKAIVAVERKLCRALFHVAQGQPFDANKLFDARRLGIELPTEAA
jgi:transposase